MEPSLDTPAEKSIWFHHFFIEFEAGQNTRLELEGQLRANM